MAVSGQKRKAIGEPYTLHLETSGSSSAAFAEMQAYQKRRRFDQVCTGLAMLSRGSGFYSFGIERQRRTPNSSFVKGGGP